MGPSDSDVSRLLAGEPPVDDPGLSEVGGFLTDLREAFPPPSVDGVRESHVAAMAQEARRQAELTPPRRRRMARQTAAVVSVAALSVFGAGVGVAAAMGADPLGLLPGLRLGPPEAPRSATPAPRPSDPVPAPSSISPPRPRTPPPTAAGVHTGKPTPAPSVKRTDKDEPKSNNGKSDEAKAEHKPTAMPTQAKNDKANPPAKANPPVKASPPAKARPTDKPSPPSKRGKGAG